MDKIKRIQEIRLIHPSQPLFGRELFRGGVGVDERASEERGWGDVWMLGGLASNQGSFPRWTLTSKCWMKIFRYLQYDFAFASSNTHMGGFLGQQGVVYLKRGQVEEARYSGFRGSMALAPIEKTDGGPYKPPNLGIVPSTLNPL